MVPSNQPPVLLYRVVTCMDVEATDLFDRIHYSNFYSMGQWCSDEGKPVVGIQLFYYGVGWITAKLVGTNGSVVYGNGECGDLIVTDSLCPVVSIDFGNKDTLFSIVGLVNRVGGNIVEVKLNLVASTYHCLFSFTLTIK